MSDSHTCVWLIIHILFPKILSIDSSGTHHAFVCQDKCDTDLLVHYGFQWQFGIIRILLKTQFYKDINTGTQKQTANYLAYDDTESVKNSEAYKKLQSL